MKQKFQFPVEESNDQYNMGFLYGLRSAGFNIEIIENDLKLEKYPKISVTFNEKLLPSSVYTALSELGFVEVKN